MLDENYIDSEKVLYAYQDYAKFLSCIEVDYALEACSNNCLKIFIYY